jgi:predicted DNA binding CopG/RHH family protein
MAAVSKPTVL